MKKTTCLTFDFLYNNVDTLFIHSYTQVIHGYIEHIHYDVLDDNDDDVLNWKKNIC